MVPRRDYHRKEFHNPFFGKRRADARRRPTAVWLIAALALIALLVWLQRGAAFQIQTVEVRGEPIISRQEITSVVEQQLDHRRWLVFHQRSIFFFSPRRAERALAEQFGKDYLTVRKRYFQSVIVSVNQDVSRVAWSTGQKTFYLDERGVALREATSPESTVEAGRGSTEVIRTQQQFGGQPLIIDQSAAEVTIGQSATSPELVVFVRDLTAFVYERGDFEIASYTMPSAHADQLTMQTTSGWAAYFRTTDSVEAQANRLLTVLAQRVPDRSKLEYIDLRYEDKVFYK